MIAISPAEAVVGPVDIDINAIWACKDSDGETVLSDLEPFEVKSDDGTYFRKHQQATRWIIVYEHWVPIERGTKCRIEMIPVEDLVSDADLLDGVDE